MAANRFRWIWALGAALASTAMAGPDTPCTVASQTKARDLLLKALTNGERIAMHAVVLQRVANDVGAACQYTVTQDANGRRKMVAVKPLVVQGMMSFDDGEQWVNFYPDENRMIVMPSPRSDRDDAGTIMKLASANYRFAMEPRARIAGRSATVVVAIPKFAGMPVRKYAIDDASHVLLRVEAFDPQGSRDVFFDTKAIQIATNGVKFNFKFEQDAAVRVYRPEPPVRVRSLAEARQHAGFQPVSIRSFPNGFEPKETIVAGQKGSRYVAMRLTDGLVSATLYQFSGRKSPVGDVGDGFDFYHNGVTLRLVGELSSEARERMISGIARSFGRTIGQFREPQVPRQTFSPKRLPEPEAVEIELAQSIARIVEEWLQEAFSDFDPLQFGSKL